MMTASSSTCRRACKRSCASPSRVPVSGRAGDGLATLPLPGLRGTLELNLPRGWTAIADDAPLTTGADGVLRAALPGATSVALRLRPIDAAAVAAGVRLATESAWQLALGEDRVELAGTVAFTVRAGALRTATLRLPAGWAATTVDGPGVAGWSQQGEAVTVTWSAPQTGSARVALAAVAARPAAERIDARVGIDGAELAAGRLALRATAGERPQLEEDPALRRDEPRGDEARAVRWSEAPARLLVTWARSSEALTVTAHAAALVDADRVQLALHLALAGRGAWDGGLIALPEPWRLVDVSGAAGALTVQGGTRGVRLGVATPLGDGARITVRLDADRAALGARFAVPALLPSGLTCERVRWLVGDAPGWRAGAEPGAGVIADDVAAVARVLELSGIAGRWRQAWRRPADGTLAIALAPEAVRLAASASHYLVLGADELRWSARLQLTPEEGAAGAFTIDLPPGAQVRAVRCRDLAEQRRDGQTVRLRLAAPSRTAVVVELDLALPLSAGVVAAGGLTVRDALLGAQAVALVADDDGAQVTTRGSSLDARRDLPMQFPLGVDPSLVTERWSATANDWRLEVRRAALDPVGTDDGLVTLVDAQAAVAADGEIRARATWHLINRSRSRIAVRLPEGVTLWEARVDGAVTVPRALETADRVAIPVRPLRAGEGATRLVLTWRQAAATGPLRARLPVLDGVKLTQVVWRFSAPDGATLTWRAGALRPTTAADGEAARAQRVVDELRRLRDQGGNLKDAALARCNGSLAALELELQDNVIALHRFGGSVAVPAQAGGAAADAQQELFVQGWDYSGNSNRELIETLAMSSAALRSQSTFNAEVIQTRAGKRGKLNLTQDNQRWQSDAPALANVQAKAEAPTVRSDDLPARAAVGALPWSSALAVASGGLGAGEAPAGWRNAADRALLGVDLLSDLVDPALVLAGQGGDIEIELAMERPAAPWWPWLLLAAGVLAAAGVLVRRR